MWQALEAEIPLPVIQNNFDRPNYRLMGNRDIWDPHGRSNYLSRLNAFTPMPPRMRIFISMILTISAQITA